MKSGYVLSLALAGIYSCLCLADLIWLRIAIFLMFAGISACLGWITDWYLHQIPIGWLQYSSAILCVSLLYISAAVCFFVIVLSIPIRERAGEIEYRLRKRREK